MCQKGQFGKGPIVIRRRQVKGGILPKKFLLFFLIFLISPKAKIAIVFRFKFVRFRESNRGFQGNRNFQLGGVEIYRIRSL